jgi:hypothetical protein
MLAFLQGSAAHTASSLLEQRSAGALLKLAYIHAVLQNALLCRCMETFLHGGSSREPPDRRSRHSRIADFQEGGGTKS